MFWNKNSNPEAVDTKERIDFVLKLATLQYSHLAMLKLSKRYDPKNNQRQKILTYMYYDILAGTLISSSSTDLHDDSVALCRDLCLELFEIMDANSIELIIQNRQAISQKLREIQVTYTPF